MNIKKAFLSMAMAMVCATGAFSEGISLTVGAKTYSLRELSQRRNN